MAVPAHILLVEDNLGDVALIQASFADAGVAARFTVAQNAPQAYRLMRTPNEPRPDLIIVDLNLPIIRGHEVLREIKAHRSWSGIPVVVFSSSALQRDIDGARALGATAYIIKPKGYEGYGELVAHARSHLAQRPPAMSRDAMDAPPRMPRWLSAPELLERWMRPDALRVLPRLPGWTSG